MKKTRIGNEAYWDMCQNCKYVCTNRSAVGSEFDTHYCKANYKPIIAFGYECDKFKTLNEE